MGVANRAVIGESKWPLMLGKRKFVLVAPKFSLIKRAFTNHDYNPREPNLGKINEIKGSISQFSMLTPLTCALLPEDAEIKNDEKVILLDGRHRYEALIELTSPIQDWSYNENEVDIKILYGLSKSDLLIMSTYLNRTRKNLKKGEYFASVVKIYEAAELEYLNKKGVMPLESEIFEKIDVNALRDRKFDLSIGRIVGTVAMDPEENGGWAPKVGSSQGQKYMVDGQNYYCPLTAGNLAVFLRYLCKSDAYNDHGQTRKIEIANVSELGKLFNKLVLDVKLEKRDIPAKSNVASKYWCMDAFGKILSDKKKIFTGSKGTLMSSANIDWGKIEAVVKTYGEIMTIQAEKNRDYLSNNKEDLEQLKGLWTYQTQRDQVEKPLKGELENSLPWFR